MLCHINKDNIIWPEKNSQKTTNCMTDSCLVLNSNHKQQEAFSNNLLVFCMNFILNDTNSSWSDWSITSSKWKNSTYAFLNHSLLKDIGLRWPQTKRMTFCLKGSTINTRLHSTGKWKFLSLKSLTMRSIIIKNYTSKVWTLRIHIGTLQELLLSSPNLNAGMSIITDHMKEYSSWKQTCLRPHTAEQRWSQYL